VEQSARAALTVALCLALGSSASANDGCCCPDSPTFSRPDLPQVVIGVVIAAVDSTAWAVEVLATWSTDTPDTLLVATFPHAPETACWRRTQRFLTVGRRYLLSTTDADTIGHCLPTQEFDPRSSAFHRLGTPARIRSDFDWSVPTVDDTIDALRHPDPVVARQYLWDLPSDLARRTKIRDVILEVGVDNDKIYSGGQPWLSYALHVDASDPVLLEQIRGGRGAAEYWAQLMWTSGMATKARGGSVDRAFLDFDVNTPELLDVLRIRFESDTSIEAERLRFWLHLARVSTSDEMRTLLLEGARHPSWHVRDLVPEIAVQSPIRVDDWTLVELFADYAAEPALGRGKNYWFYASPAFESALASGLLDENRICEICSADQERAEPIDCSNLLERLAFTCVGAEPGGE